MRDEDRLAERLATWFGCGRSPVAPGTVGSLGAVPLHFALRLLPPLPHAAAIAAITAVGLWASEKEAQRLGEEDPQSVVIDEVAGTLIAMAMTRRMGLSTQLLALALFRAYDIIKPGPIDSVQHAEPAGLGIMADDLLAGVMAGLTARWLARR